MGTALISSFISGAIAIISIAISTYNQNRINKLNESLDVRRKHQYYIEPLIRSALRDPLIISPKRNHV